MKSQQHSFSSLRQGLSDHMSLTFETEGFSPLVGKIFASLLFSAEPVSLQQLADQLGVTKAAISVQVRTLEKHLLCQKLPTSSDRKDYYYISDDFSMNAVKNSIVKIQRSVDHIELTLQLFNSLENVDAKDLPSHDMSRRRFIEMQALHQMYLNRLVGLEEEWDERRQKLLLDD